MPEEIRSYDMPFPTRLRALLDETGVSQQELADYVGVKRQTIAQWKDGKTVPDMYNFKRIAEYFKLPYEYLYGDTESKIKENMDLSGSLGLKDEAISNLKSWRIRGTLVPTIRFNDLLSDMLSHDGFDQLLNCIGRQARQYLISRNHDENELPTINIPDSPSIENEYWNSPSKQDLGMDIATSMDLTDFYQYQAVQLFEYIINQLLDRYYQEGHTI